METDIYSRCRQLEEKFKDQYGCAAGKNGSSFGSLADLLWDLFPDNYQTDPRDLKPFQEYKLHCIRIRSRNAKDIISDWIPYLGELMWKRGIAGDEDYLKNKDFINMGTLIENLGELFKVCENLQDHSECEIERRIKWEKANPELAMVKKESVCTRC